MNISNIHISNCGYPPNISNGLGLVWLQQSYVCTETPNYDIDMGNQNAPYTLGLAKIKKIGQSKMLVEPASTLSIWIQKIAKFLF